MRDFLNGAGLVFFYSAVATAFAWALHRFSRVFFGLVLADEIKKGNQAAAAVSVGIFVLLGLVIGLIAK